MLVLREFPGDENQILKSIQANLYGETVSRIFATQRQRYLNAANLVGVDNSLSLRLRQTSSFDHRTLQLAHDDFAALFRFLHPCASQLQLGQSEDSLRMELEKSWHKFIDDQLAVLSTNDEFTRAVCNAVAFPNETLGVSAEATLHQILLECAESHGLTLKDAGQCNEAFEHNETTR